ncbi:MAG: hypothetical protein JO041_08705 [Acidobacteria bacterium]|nr:hypothetical protein [Acidobacteriota bacterium]
MKRQRTLQILLMVVGVLFTAAVIPLIMLVRRDPGTAMMMSLYTTLGVFLLLAARSPSTNRTLIGFAAWSSLAHASLMAVQSYLGIIARRELAGVAIFALIGVLLLAVAPARQQDASAAGGQA